MNIVLTELYELNRAKPAHARHGGISLPADPQACSDKTAKIIGKALGAPRNAK